MRMLIVGIARCKRGATAVEYALLACCIAAALAGTFQTFGSTLQSLWGNVADRFVAAQP